MMYSALIEQLITSLRCLPGIGPKSAQRMAFHLLQRDRKGAANLLHVLQQSLEKVAHCHRCNNLCEEEICAICKSPRRNNSLLCIVESPIDVVAVEQTGIFLGLYFVLMGHLSPIDGIGPHDLGIDQLEKRFQQGEIAEIILATNATVEGEATAHYIAELAKKYHIKTSRIAYGVPMGSELEFIDGGTLARALERRENY